jgi:hypothetical protein
MSKQHFEAIAAILRRRCANEAVRSTAAELAEYFQSTNERFDKARFLKAANCDD